MINYALIKFAPIFYGRRKARKITLLGPEKVAEKSIEHSGHGKQIQSGGVRCKGKGRHNNHNDDDGEKLEFMITLDAACCLLFAASGVN